MEVIAAAFRATMWIVLFILAAVFMWTFTAPLLLSLGMAQDGWTLLWSIVISLLAAAVPFGLVLALDY